jgi:VanZ family protein
MFQLGARAAFWLLLALICFWTLAPVSYRPQTGHAMFERFWAFLALGGALAAGYPRRPLMVATIICLVALGSEALQAIVPTRDARPVDAVEKTAGGLAGVAAVASLTSGLRAARRR